MAITVKIEEKQDKEITFPTLMRSKRTGLVVLFMGKRDGVVLYVRETESVYTIGYMSDTWDEVDNGDWEPSPPITISNA